MENVHLGDSLMSLATACETRSDAMAKLYFRYGAMNSGKSTALMQWPTTMKSRACRC